MFGKGNNVTHWLPIIDYNLNSFSHLSKIEKFMINAWTRKQDSSASHRTILGYLDSIRNFIGVSYIY